MHQAVIQQQEKNSHIKRNDIVKLSWCGHANRVWSIEKVSCSKVAEMAKKSEGRILDHHHSTGGIKFMKVEWKNGYRGIVALWTLEKIEQKQIQKR